MRHQRTSAIPIPGITGNRSAYAQHRAELGLECRSTEGVTVAIKRGMPVLPNGLINFRQADQWFVESITRVGRRTGGAAPRKPTASAPDDPPVAIGSNAQYMMHRAEHERIKALQADLDYKKALEDLVSRADVRLAFARIVEAAKNRLLILPDEIAPRVAAMTSVREIRALVDGEIRDALKALSETELTEAQAQASSEAA